MPSYRKSQLVKQHNSQRDGYMYKAESVHNGTLAWLRAQGVPRTCKLAELIAELERLHREVAGRGEDERADAGARVTAAEAL